MRPTRRLLLALIPLSVSLQAVAQTDTMEVELAPIEVEASRTELTTRTAPYAVDVVVRDVERQATAPLSLTEALAALPGVWLNDRDHLALGERLSIRGMGWRSAFGVRGVQVLYDGIPLTMPDGQTVLDIVDPSLVGRAEVIRGPASTIWGNAGGGVLYLSSPSPRRESMRVGGAAGSYGLARLEADGSARFGRHRLAAAVTHLERDGYREHSRARHTRAQANGIFDLGGNAEFRVTAAFISAPLTEHPGALTAPEVDADPRAADARYVNTASGKDSRQGQVGATLTYFSGLGLLTATVYGVSRTLDNPLPFFYSRLDRRAGGTRLSLQRSAGPVDFVAGADAGRQSDDRTRWGNDGGVPDGEVRLEQTETVANAALFATASIDFRPLTLHGGLRFDRLRFEADDLLLVNGDQSGNRTFSAWSPSLGAFVDLEPLQLFANLSTSFESPTTTELINRPDLAGGFNPDLEPQRTLGGEAGGRWTRARAEVRLAVFSQRVRDQLIPFQTPEGGGQTFFRNEGATRQSGAEVSFRADPSGPINVRGHYAYARYRFDGGTYDGNELPGQPAHRVFLEPRLRRDAWYAALQIEAASGQQVDDANSEEADAYALLHLNAAHTGIPVCDTARLLPFVTVRNVADRAYIASVVVNARGGRYYEPGPGRTWLAGLRLVF